MRSLLLGSNRIIVSIVLFPQNIPATLEFGRLRGMSIKLTIKIFCNLFVSLLLKDCSKPLECRRPAVCQEYMNKTIPRIVRGANRHLHGRFQTTQPFAILEPSQTIVLPPASNTHTDNVKVHYSSHKVLEAASPSRTHIAEAHHL
jgi:hypothetical protein